jgi:dsRNA-specific ribonuclease
MTNGVFIHLFARVINSTLLLGVCIYHCLPCEPRSLCLFLLIRYTRLTLHSRATDDEGNAISENDMAENADVVAPGRVPSGWIDDEAGTNIPDISSEPMQIFDKVSVETREKVLTARSHDQHSNYEDLEFLGDSAVHTAVSQLVVEKHGELEGNQRSVSLLRL